VSETDEPQADEAQSEPTLPLVADGGAGDGTQAEPAGELDPVSALGEYRQLMDQRDAAEDAYKAEIEPLKKAHDDAVKPIDDRLAELEAWFLDHAAANDKEAFFSPDAHVTVSVRESPKITDADSFFAWAAASNNVHLLQKRVSVTQFREYVKTNPDDQPPGVTVEHDRSIKFKRP